MSCYPRTATFSQCGGLDGPGYGTLSFLSLSEAVFPVSLLLRTKLGSSEAGLASETKAPASQGLADLGGLWEFVSSSSERSLVNAGGSACSSSCWLPTPLQVRSDQGAGLIEEVAGSADASAGAPGSLEHATQGRLVYGPSGPPGKARLALHLHLAPAFCPPPWASSSSLSLLLASTHLEGVPLPLGHL